MAERRHMAYLADRISGQIGSWAKIHSTCQPGKCRDTGFRRMTVKVSDNPTIKIGKENWQTFPPLQTSVFYLQQSAALRSDYGRGLRFGSGHTHADAV